MAKPKTKGAEDARKELPALLDDAESGRATVITRHGRPIAALIPIERFTNASQPQLSLLSVAGTGRGLWGKDSTRFLRDLRDEWER